MDAKGHRVVAQEPGVVELDNDRLLLWVRTDVGEQYGCSSEDGGENWSPLKPTGIASPRSPATIERVPSTKDLVMVWNDHADLPIAQRKHRTPLSVAISRDGGETWINTRTLADDPFGWYCYTAMTFIEDYVLLGHCAGDRRTGGLNTTQITRVPLKWIYP